jgi:uncharacterized membrane protein YedE/YeeE
MKNLIYLLFGILFGVVMTKGEIISWYRIHEMFRFESIHMYGVIGVAVIVGAIGYFIIKKMGNKALTGEEINLRIIPLNMKRHIIAGSIFGLGWALVGSCPGPMFILVGNGYMYFLWVILGATLGTLLYGLVKARLPH